jgi:hypothetical protein
VSTPERDEAGLVVGGAPGLRSYVPMGLVAVALAGIALTAWAFGGGDDDPSSTRPVSTLGPVLVGYYVSGTATSASITYSAGDGGTAQQECVDVPIKRKSDGGEGLTTPMDRGSFAYLAAQNCGEEGYVTCAIRIDDHEVVRNTSFGAYTIATCSTRT